MRIRGGSDSPLADRLPARRRRGRPALGEDEVAARVTRYCERYGVDALAHGGLPPFPSGRRETAQHREWLAVYRAVKRLSARRAGAGGITDPSAARGVHACAICGRPATEGVARVLGPSRSPLRLDAPCAELAERAREAGPEALARVAAMLWPPRRGSR